MNNQPTHRTLNSALKEQEVKGTRAQTKYQLQEQKGAKKFAKYALITLGAGAIIAGGLYAALHITKGQKDLAVNQVAAQEKTLTNTAADYIIKAHDRMKEGNVVSAIDFVNKAEALDTGIQYAAIANDLSSAKDFKAQYDERNEKVKALISEQNYDLALKVLSQADVYNPNTDKMSYSQKVLADKMSKLGVDVVEHSELEGKINHLVQVRDEQKRLTSQAIALSRKLKDTQHTLTVDNATLDGAVDSTIAISYRPIPASELSGASVTISTKKGTQMVLKDDNQKFLYHVAVKLENILPDRYFGASQLSQLFQSGELTSLKIEENNGAYSLTFMNNKRKETQYKIDNRFNVQISGIMSDLTNYKGVSK
jgi:hypothetical protein